MFLLDKVSYKKMFLLEKKKIKEKIFLPKVSENENEMWN